MAPAPHMLSIHPSGFGNSRRSVASIHLMNALSDLLSALLRGVFRVVLFLAGLLFVLSFLAAAIVVVLGMSLWSLLTGRKPAPLVLFSQMRERSRRYTAGAWSAGATTSTADVVDVEATEIRPSGVARPLTPIDRPSR